MDPPRSTPRRFQTRKGIQRASKEDREAFERAEAERRQQRLAEAPQIPSAAARGRSTTTARGRGAPVVNTSERLRNENTGGVFGPALPGSSRTRGAGSLRPTPTPADVNHNALDVDRPNTDGAFLNSSIPVVGGEKPAKATPGRKKNTTTKKGEPVTVSSDDGVEEGTRRDIETIEISSDDASDAPLTNTSKSKRRADRPPKGRISLRPFRAAREPPEIRELDQLERARQVQRSARGRERRQDGEAGLEGSAVDDDLIEFDEGFQGGMDDMDFTLQHIEAKTKPSRKKGSSGKDPKQASESIEERSERRRHQDDVHKLRDELLMRSPTKAPTEDLDMTEPDRLDYTTQNVRDGRLYLFQFPPLTPMLSDPGGRVEIIQEPELEHSSASGAVSEPRPSKDKGKAPTIKKENEGSEDVKTQIPNERLKVLTAETGHLPSGMAGKLKVHRSGKVTLDWGGGTNLEVRWGSEVDFLQDAVLVGGAEDGEKVEKTAWALGQVRKKMVVIPDWQKIYE